MARISYGVYGRRSSWWVGLPLWAWVLGSPLIVAAMVFVPMTKWFVKIYAWPLTASWKMATRSRRHRVSRRPVRVAQPVYLTGYVDRRGVFHPFR
jgi:hypothetical protein